MHTISQKYYYSVFILAGKCKSLGITRYFNTTFMTQTSIQIEYFDYSNNYLPSSNYEIARVYTRYNTIYVYIFY